MISISHSMFRIVPKCCLNSVEKYSNCIKLLNAVIVKYSHCKNQSNGQVITARRLSYGKAYMPYLCVFEKHAGHFGGFCKFLDKRDFFIGSSRYYSVEESPARLKSEIVVSEREEDLRQNVAQEIFDSCCDKRLKNQGVAKVRGIVDKSVECGFSLEKVKNIFYKSPKLIHHCNIQAVTEHLKAYGFRNRQIETMFSGNGKILTMDIKVITKCLEILRGIGLSNKSILKLTSENPSILDTSSQNIHSRYMSLRHNFSAKDCVKLIEMMPIALTKGTDDILELCNYVNNVMGIDSKQILHSFLFKHSLVHVRNRHIFLVRAGIFKQLKKKKGEIDPNPRLRDIVDTSDEKFVKKFGNMAVEDYEMFCKLYAIEMGDKTIENMVDDRDDDKEKDFSDDDDDSDEEKD